MSRNDEVHFARGMFIGVAIGVFVTHVFLWVIA